MNWTQEIIRAEDRYHREQLHRLASHRRRSSDAADSSGPARVGLVHRVLRWGGRPRPADNPG